jgi:hypothetical protein
MLSLLSTIATSRRDAVVAVRIALLLVKYGVLRLFQRLLHGGNSTQFASVHRDYAAVVFILPVVHMLFCCHCFVLCFSFIAVLQTGRKDASLLE